MNDRVHSRSLVRMRLLQLRLCFERFLADWIAQCAAVGLSLEGMNTPAVTEFLEVGHNIPCRSRCSTRHRGMHGRFRVRCMQAGACYSCSVASRSVTLTVAHMMCCSLSAGSPPRRS